MGITGPPGVGKSTLSAALIRHWRARGQSVGVLAVDPSSPKSGGALLGDRLRMMSLPSDDGVFIRSLAGRGDLGGLSADVLPMAQVMLAALEIVLLETVGVGQSEVDIADHADTVCLVIQPAGGDVIQFLKAGVTEIPDVIVVNKADLGQPAVRAANDARAAAGGGSAGEVLLVSATDNRGVAELVEAIGAHRCELTEQRPGVLESELTRQRRRAGQRWVEKRLRETYGRHGLALLGGRREMEQLVDAAGGSLFDRLAALEERLLATWRDRNET